MADFHEVQFPPTISAGAVGGPSWSTTVLTLASGFERRNINWSKSRAMYEVSHGVKTQAQIDELIAFFMARRGKAYGFRFKDWADYKVPNDGGVRPTMMTTDGGTTTTFQLTKVYTDTAGSYTRTITKPVSGTLQVYSDGVLTASWSANYATGVVTLAAPLSATTGKVITVQFEFDVPVRFDTDVMRSEIGTLDNHGWSQINLVEIRV